MESPSIDELFESLKQASDARTGAAAPAETASIPSRADHDQDVIAVDDLSNDKVMKQELQFQAIEKNLRELPKLQSDFDNLARAGATLAPLEPGLPSKQQKPPTTSETWFRLPKPELTPQLKRDIALIQHRAALDPKRHYKKEKWQVPERFSVGTVIEGSAEYYSSRLKNSQRKNTILETLMTDDDTNKYFRRKYSEVQAKKTSGKRGHYKRVREQRRKF